MNLAQPIILAHLQTSYGVSPHKSTMYTKTTSTTSLTMPCHLFPSSTTTPVAPSQSTAPDLSNDKAVRLSLPLLLISGFTTFSLLVWCLAWSVMIFLIDRERVQMSLASNLILFQLISWGFPAVIIYSQYQLMATPYFMTERDNRLMAMVRILGVLFILFIFRYFYFDILVAKDLRDFLPDNAVIDINQGI